MLFRKNGSIWETFVPLSVFFAKNDPTKGMVFWLQSKGLGSTCMFTLETYVFCIFHIYAKKKS